MGKTFRQWTLEQNLMFPPSLQDLVPETHLCRFVLQVVSEELDIRQITGAYQKYRGQPPYHPAMMTALLLYSYTQGVYSSRRIALAAEQRVDFMTVTAMQKPDFRTISRFRKRHAAALKGLFKQVVRMCQMAGMIKLGHVAIDGTRISGNAAKDQNLTYRKIVEQQQEIEQQIGEWFQKAEQTDDQEDQLYGNKRGDELPDWLTDKARRMEKLKQAKADLEAAAEAEQKREAGAAKPAEKREQKPISETPDDETKTNLTDPESRLLRTKDGFIQGYNAQIAVDGDSQVIVAESLSNDRVDVRQLLPLIELVESCTGDAPTEISGDSGYYSEQNLQHLKDIGIRGYIAAGRWRKGKWAGAVGPLGKEMRGRFNRGGRKSRYRLRKQTVEPVFGIIKAARGFRQFLMRGLANVQVEWSLLCTAHNILKLFRQTVAI